MHKWFKKNNFYRVRRQKNCEIWQKQYLMAGLFNLEINQGFLIMRQTNVPGPGYFWLTVEKILDAGIKNRENRIRYNVSLENGQDKSIYASNLTFTELQNKFSRFERLVEPNIEIISK